MCFSKEYHGVSLGAEQIDELKSKYNKGNNNVQDEKFGMPDDMQKSSRWINNVEELTEVEDFIERRGL